MATKRIAIVGCGPRGLVALEAIIERLAKRQVRQPLEIVLLESTRYPGSGPNYAPDQTASNLLNIPLREMPVAARSAVDGDLAYDEFPSFIRWYKDAYSDDRELQVDHFPTRAAVGEYLQARLYSILEQPQNKNHVVLHAKTTVIATGCDRNQWTVSVEPVLELPLFDELLLCIGHQATKADSAIEQWRDARHLFENPYPCEPIIKSKHIDNSSTVALRGMGLSMIDVVKALTVGRGGIFTIKDNASRQFIYEASGSEPALMLPFSLDGQPMAPKPMNRFLDDHYKLSPAAMKVCELALDFTEKPPVDLRALLVEQVVLHTPEIFFNLQADTDNSIDPIADQQQLQNVARQWLLDETYQHPLIVDSAAPTAFIMQQFLDMATGRQPASLDYTIGQIWRHLQPTFYKSLRFQNFDGDVIDAALALDARMKRYAFGPPVDAVAQLLALHDCGLLKFCIADDPDIGLTEEGWVLKDGNEMVVSNVMVNTVLDSVQLKAIKTPLVNHLQAQGLISRVHDNLAARANSSGQLLNDAAVPVNLSAAGRLITGSIVEADALMNCFNDELYLWAEAALDRLSRLKYSSL